MSDSNKELFKGLAEISEVMEQARYEHEGRVEEWWLDLSQQEREYAFYAVIKRMYRAEVKDRGSYRHAIYSVFGFDAGMYGQGMDCGYMDLHNLIHAGLQHNAKPQEEQKNESQD